MVAMSIWPMLPDVLDASHRADGVARTDVFKILPIAASVEQAGEGDLKGQFRPNVPDRPQESRRRDDPARLRGSNRVGRVVVANGLRKARDVALLDRHRHRLTFHADGLFAHFIG